MSHTTINTIETIEFLNDRLMSLVDCMASPKQTVLWIGAGMSAKFARFPTWAQFLKDLLTECGSGLGHDRALIEGLINSGRLAVAAECLYDHLGESILDRLHSCFSAPFSSLPTSLRPFCLRELITTNYDTILESAMPWYEPVSPSQELETLLRPTFRIVKLHGTVKVPSSCVLTLSSYIRAYTVNLRWYLADVFSRNNVVFFGSSMNRSEPFFRTLSFLKQTHRLTDRRRIAVVSVPDSDAGKKLGKRLESYNIDLIPYIPNLEHSFLDDLFKHIFDRLPETRSYVSERIIDANHDRVSKRWIEASVKLNTLSSFSITDQKARIGFGDSVSRFFEEAVNSGQMDSIMRSCSASGASVDDLLDRSLAVVLPRTKSVARLERIVPKLEEISGQPYVEIRAKLKKLKGV